MDNNIEMEPAKKSNGALVGSIIVIIILIIGGIYVWQMRAKTVEENKAIEQKLLQESQKAEQNTVVKEITPADTTELNALEQDLNRADTSTGVDATKIQ